MKSIGDQAKEFRERMGWSTKQMAFACHTSRQNIESLEKVGSRTPKYVHALAKAMGTTVDVLLEGRYAFDPARAPAVDFPKEVQRTRAKAPDAAELERAVAVVSAAIQTADELTRIQLEPLAALWARKPDQNGHIAQRIVLLLAGSRVSQLSSDDQTSSGSGQDFEIDADGSAGNGSSDNAGDEEKRQSGTGGAAGGDAR